MSSGVPPLEAPVMIIGKRKLFSSFDAGMLMKNGQLTLQIEWLQAAAVEQCERSHFGELEGEMCHLGACKAQGPGMTVLQNNILYTVAGNHTFLLLRSTEFVSGRTDIQTDRQTGHQCTDRQVTNRQATQTDTHTLYWCMQYMLSWKHDVQFWEGFARVRAPFAACFEANIQGQNRH